MALGTILLPAIEAATGGSSILGSLSSASSILGSLGGLFGGGGDDGTKKQFAYNMASQYYSPLHQVRGMRRAGLNPMLAATRGINAPQGVTNPNQVSDDRIVGIQRASALSMIANQSAQAKLYNAQAEKVEAETNSERERPENIRMSTSHLRSQAMMFEALEVQAKNQGLNIAAHTAQQELINQINATGWLTEMKKNELKQKINELTISSAQAERAKTDKAFFDSEIGKILRLVEHVTNALGLSRGSPSSAKGLR